MKIPDNSSKHLNIFQKLFKSRDQISKLTFDDNMNHDQKLFLTYFISLIDNYPGIIMLLSLEGNIISYNEKSVKRYLGLDSKQKFTFEEIVYKQDFPLLISAFNKAKLGSTTQVEVKMFTKDRKQIDVISTFIPIGLNKKIIDGVIVISENITKFKALKESDRLKANHLEQAQQIANIGSWEYVIADDKMECSQACLDIFGFDQMEKLTMDSLLSHAHPEDYERLYSSMNNACENGIEFQDEYRISHSKSRKLRYITIKIQVVMKNHKPCKLIGIVKDETEQKLLNLELLETNKRYHYMFDHLHAGIWMRDFEHERNSFFSKGLARLLNIDPTIFEEDKDSWFKMVLPMYRESVKNKYAQLDKGRAIELRYRIVDGIGVTKWVYEQTIPRVNDRGEITHTFGMLTDISQQVELKEKLNFLAKHDALTSLPNYYSLHEKLDELITSDSSKKFALFFIDIDNFNDLNHSLGFQIADKVIKRVSNRLINVLPENSYLAKLDYDTFALIINDYENKEAIFQFAERILEVIENELIISDYKVYITASVGVSFYPDYANKKETLLNNTKTALFHAKRRGKNNYQIYSFNRNIDSFKKYMLEKDLRKAIENEEFELYYQPQVNPHTEAVIGAEALIRWNHKEWGIVSPAEFIPIAEEKHLIHKISDLVIRAVCKQLSNWQEQEYNLIPIAVNISPLRFLKPGLVETVKTSLEQFNIPAKYLELEITESSLLEDENHISDKINKLKDLGIKIAIDDFGTGFTSFHLLQHFHFDKIKIDRSFIQKLSLSDNNGVKEKAIVSSFLYLGKELNVDVVAEGVEEYEQLEFLQQKECNIIQGYIYSKPVPFDQFERMMKVRYIKPKKQKQFIKPKIERRKYYRFVFSHYLPVKMYVTEVNKRKVNIGSVDVLVENISLGGIRFLTTLRLPVSPNIKLKFKFTILNINFDIDGTLVYKNEEKAEVFSYGISFQMNEGTRDKLAKIINRLTILTKLNNDIPGTHFIKENPYYYLRKDLK